MRLPIYDKPRIIDCGEIYTELERLNEEAAVVELVRGCNKKKATVLGILHLHLQGTTPLLSDVMVSKKVDVGGKLYKTHVIICTLFTKELLYTQLP